MSRQISPMFVDLARREVSEAIEAIPEEFETEGIFVRELDDGKEVWVTRMMFNWRIAEMDGWFPYRHWCYVGLDVATFLLATRQAWSGDGSHG